MWINTSVPSAMYVAIVPLEGNGCQELPYNLPKARMAYATNTSVVYRCSGDYELNAGDLVRTCINGTWTGFPPSCTAEGLLPKGYMVLLIVGGIILLFLICIPVDFYRYRKRKKVCRERRERMEMMTRIEPLHANLDRGYPLTGNEQASNEPAKFSFRSILSFFRLVRNTRKRNEEKRNASRTATVDAGGQNQDSPTESINMQITNANGIHKLPDIRETNENPGFDSAETELHAVSSVVQVTNENEENPVFNPMGLAYDSPTKSLPSVNLLSDGVTEKVPKHKTFRISEVGPPRSRSDETVTDKDSNRYERVQLVSEYHSAAMFKGKKTRRTSLPPLVDPTGPPEQPINID